MRTTFFESREFIQNRIELCKLAFDRAEERWDIHAMNLAAVKAEYWRAKLDACSLVPRTINGNTVTV